MRIQNQMPRSPSSVVSDNIRFEDALGRVRSLQYDVFRHWEVRYVDYYYAFSVLTVWWLWKDLRLARCFLTGVSDL